VNDNENEDVEMLDDSIGNTPRTMKATVKRRSTTIDGNDGDNVDNKRFKAPREFGWGM